MRDHREGLGHRVHRKVVAKVGPVKATFGGKVSYPTAAAFGLYHHRRRDRRRRRLRRGSAKVALAEDGDETVLSYAVQRRSAQIGADRSRLIDATSRKMAAEFFGRFVTAMTPGDGAAG